MPKRISYSLLDPVFMPGIRWLYGKMHIPTAFPPEGLIAVGHCLAILAAAGFAYAPSRWWGGLLVAFGVVGNHLVDCWDGAHARATNQCRNGGELLDHFVDPLSFSYYLSGMAVAIDRLDWGLAAMICLYATSVLTNIKAKMIGEFTLARFGPTEFKSLLILYGLAMVFWPRARDLPSTGVDSVRATKWFFGTLILTGIAQLVVNLIHAVREVNAVGKSPDTTDLEMK